MDRRTARIAQLQMPGNEIRVEMREKNVADLQAKLLRIHDVLMNIPLRIDNHRSPALLVSQQIGGVGQTT